jgi:hypothetical protein
MRTHGLLVLGIVATVSGCTHTTVINLSDVEACRQLSEETARRKVTVGLADGRELDAQGLVLSPDSTSWLDPDTEDLMTVGTAEIATVRMVDRGRGAGEGLGLGVLTGALTGAVVGLVYLSEEYYLGYNVGVGAGAFGVAGLFVGPLVGAGVGHQDIYRFEAPEPQEGL